MNQSRVPDLSTNTVDFERPVVCLVRSKAVLAISVVLTLYIFGIDELDTEKAVVIFQSYLGGCIMTSQEDSNASTSDENRKYKRMLVLSCIGR